MKAWVKTHSKVILLIAAIAAMPFIAEFALWQGDLIRHLFIYECSNMDDAWRILFGFPPFCWFGYFVPLQTAFDLMYFLIAAVTWIQTLWITALYLRARAHNKKREANVR